ncbi:hypothetical protein AN220_27105 [Streptomyces nanshensis]|nr:hypothetical protein AN220_27105 [Streptomyces nanshensis]
MRPEVDQQAARLEGIVEGAGQLRGGAGSGGAFQLGDPAGADEHPGGEVPLGPAAPFSEPFEVDTVEGRHAR